MKKDQAKKIAIETGKRLIDFCEVLNITGALRRSYYEIQSIELICVPKEENEIVTDLFGGKEVKSGINQNYINAIKKLGAITRGKFGGRYMQVQLSNIKLDLYTPYRWDYYRRHCEITGSTSYINYTVRPAWEKLGWCATELGLRRQSDCRAIKQERGQRWELVNPNGDQAPVWTSEKEFINWCGLPYFDPKLRTI